VPHGQNRPVGGGAGPGRRRKPAPPAVLTDAGTTTASQPAVTGPPGNHEGTAQLAIHRRQEPRAAQDSPSSRSRPTAPRSTWRPSGTRSGCAVKSPLKRWGRAGCSRGAARAVPELGHPTSRSRAASRDRRAASTQSTPDTDLGRPNLPHRTVQSAVHIATPAAAGVAENPVRWHAAWSPAAGSPSSRSWLSAGAVRPAGGLVASHGRRGRAHRGAGAGRRAVTAAPESVRGSCCPAGHRAFTRDGQDGVMRPLRGGPARLARAARRGLGSAQRLRCRAARPGGTVGRPPPTSTPPGVSVLTDAALPALFTDRQANREVSIAGHRAPTGGRYTPRRRAPWPIPTPGQQGLPRGPGPETKISASTGSARHHLRGDRQRPRRPPRQQLHIPRRQVDHRAQRCRPFRAASPWPCWCRSGTVTGQPGDERAPSWRWWGLSWWASSWQGRSSR